MTFFFFQLRKASAEGVSKLPWKCDEYIVTIHRLISNILVEVHNTRLHRTDRKIVFATARGGNNIVIIRITLILTSENSRDQNIYDFEKCYIKLMRKYAKPIYWFCWLKKNHSATNIFLWTWKISIPDEFPRSNI